MYVEEKHITRPYIEAPDCAGQNAHILIESERLQARVRELGKSITEDFAGKTPLMIGVLKGAFIFLADLVRSIELDVEMDFMAVASYGAATKTSGVVRIVKDLDTDIQDRHVVVVEDIVDSGLTLSYLKKGLLARNPASLSICALLVKDGQQRASLDISYTGFNIEPYFVVGYGLDVGQRYRNLDSIYYLDQAVIS
jgi:hypoxanthine phosphoribosyltransferase